MRLSGLVIASVLFVSLTLLAQHSSGSGGSSSGGGHSGGASSGGSYSSYSGSSGWSASSHASASSASHAASTSAGASNSSSSSKSASSKSASSRQNAAPAKNTSRSFWHPFRRPKPIQNAEFHRPVRCLKGPCPVCPPGESRNGGACVVTSNYCSSGQYFNGFTCGAQYWFNDCSALASQLAAQARQMRGLDDPGQSLVYRALQQQYDSCMEHFGGASFSSFAFNDDWHLADTIP